MGENVDVRSDIYSLGATLFHALTGEFIFEASSTVEMLKKHLDHPPRKVIELKPEISERLSNCIDRMLAKDKNSRFQNCDDLIQEIYECSGQEVNTVEKRVNIDNA